MTDAAWTSLDPAAEALLEESRLRRRRALRGRERMVNAASVTAFVLAVVGLALLAPSGPTPSLALLAGLVAAYALASRVEFEIGSGSVVPTQVFLVPMLFVLPPAIVPVAVAAGFLLGRSRSTSAARSTQGASQGWYPARGIQSAPLQCSRPPEAPLRPSTHFRCSPWRWQRNSPWSS